MAHVSLSASFSRKPLADRQRSFARRALLQSSLTCAAYHILAACYYQTALDHTGNYHISCRAVPEQRSRIINDKGNTYDVPEQSRRADDVEKQKKSGAVIYVSAFYPPSAITGS